MEAASNIEGTLSDPDLNERDIPPVNPSSQAREFYKSDEYLNKVTDHVTLRKTQSKSWPPNSAHFASADLQEVGLSVGLPFDLGGQFRATVELASGINTEQTNPNVSIQGTSNEVTLGLNPIDKSETSTIRNMPSPITVRTPRERKKWVRPSSALRNDSAGGSLSDSIDSGNLRSGAFPQKDYFGNLFVSLPEHQCDKSIGQSLELSDSKNKKKSAQVPSSKKLGKTIHSKDLARSSDFDFKSALDVSLDASGPRMASPASSNTSNKLRGLEWDSGADVGYRHHTDTSLSTIERLVLASGTTAFRLQSSVVRVETGQERRGEEPSRSVPSTARTTKTQRTAREPLAQSTPIEVERKSLILRAASKGDEEKHQDDAETRKLSRKKSWSSSDLHSACSHLDEETDIQGKWNRGRKDFAMNSANQKNSFLSLTTDKSTAANQSETSNKLVQTLNLTNTQSVGVQVDTNGRSAESSSSTAETSRKQLSIEDAEKFIEKIQNNAKEHQKVIDNIRLVSTYPRKSSKSQDAANGVFDSREQYGRASPENACCNVDCKGAHKKVANNTESADGQSTSSSRGTLQLDEESKSGSSSSSYLNVTRSGNATNDRETIGSANSFEYLPGDAYEHTKAQMQDSSIPANSLSRDLELGVEALLQQTKNADPKQIKLLVQKLKEKLILADYKDDTDSSTVDKSGLDEAKNRKPQTGHRVVSGSSDSVYKSATSVFDMHHKKQQLTDTMESGHSTLPCNWSSTLSSSSTLETRNWREAVTKSEKRLEQRWTSKKVNSNFSDKQLAHINEKIHHLSNLKMILERQEKLRSSCGIKAEKFANSAFPGAYQQYARKDDRASKSSDLNESDTSPSGSGQQDRGWSSHVRLSGNTRNIQTQIPSARYDLSSEKQSSSSNAETGSESRGKHGRINVYVQTRQKHKAAPTCGCYRDSILIDKDTDQGLSVRTASESSSCPTKVSLKVTPHDKYQSKQKLWPTNGKPQDSRVPYVCHSCKCPMTEDARYSSTIFRENFAFDTRTRLASAADRKDVQANNSVNSEPIEKPAWFAREGETVNNTHPKTKLPSHDSRFDAVRRADVCTPQMENRKFCHCRETLRICCCKLTKENGQMRGFVEPETPKPIGYMLTFESSTSINVSSSSESVERRPLEVVTVRVPSKSRKQKPDSARTTHSPQSEVRSPPQRRHTSSQSSSPWRNYTHGEQKRDVNTKLKPTLQEFLQKNRPDYIQSAGYRRQCLAELAHLRELRRESRQRLLALSTQPGVKLSSQPMPPPPMAVKRVFNQQKMLRQTKKLQQKCSEVVNKKAEMKRKEDYRTNRLMAEIFTRKLQRKVLQGAVSLSNSVSVISTL